VNCDIETVVRLELSEEEYGDLFDMIQTLIVLAEANPAAEKLREKAKKLHEALPAPTNQHGMNFS
jgi:seryl-tRNA(Sec) selenium transferase